MKRFISAINNSNFQNYAAAGLLFAGIFLFLIYTGTLTSGYHLVDDHGMISIKSTLQEESFLKASVDYVKNDLNIRFRPVYYLYYISEVKLFGLDFLALSVFTGLLAFASFLLFYIGMRKLGHSFLKSMIFVFLIFVGPQMAIWWRLGTNETIGMFFLGLAFLFMAKCLDRKRYKINNILFIIFLIITSLCKESFVIVIPAFVLFKIWNEKRFFQISAKESVKKNMLSLIPVIIMLIELWIIKFVVGTNKIGYAGITSSANEFYTGVKKIVWGELSLLNWMKLLGTLLSIYLISFLFNKENKKKEFIRSVKSFSLCLFFSMMIVLPNIFMHAKSGMVERYLLPATLGLAFLAIGIWQDTRRMFFKWLMILAIFIFIAVSFDTAKKNTVIFTTEGRNANKLLSTVMMRSNPDSKILLAVDPASRFEVSYSTKTFLSFYGFKNIFGYPIMREYTSDFEIGLRDQWLKWFENRNLKDMNGQPDIIVFIYDKIQAEQFFNESGISQLEYSNVLDNNSPHAVYTKNNQ